MGIIDCFPFFNELDLLEIRLNHLAPYVDRFVLCEMPVTHSGNPKPLWFADHKERFKEFPITHLIAPPLPLKPEAGKVSDDAWRLEHYQREYLMHGLKDADPDDIVLLADLDEIPDLSTYDGAEGAFKQKLYYYYVNVYTNTRRWKGPVATRMRNIKTLTHVRNHRNTVPTVVLEGGWHFSTLGNAEQIKYKIQSFAHTELNKPEFVDAIADNLANLKDPYRRDWKRYPEYRFTVEMPSGPKYLLDNKDKFKHFFYGTT